jgi:S1-C subfamily serine protease
MQMRKSLMVAALVLTGALGLKAQQVVQHKLEGEGFFMMPETGALVVQNKDVLKIDMLPPADARPKEYASVDLKVGDVILMVNGKKVTSANQLEEMFKAIKAGEEISLGIKREGGLRLVKFNRADESKLPKRQMMMLTKDEGGDGGDQVQVQTRDGMREFTGKGARILPSSGLIIAIKDGGVAVIGVIPMAKEKISGGEVKEGDIIVTANGKAIANTDELVDLVDGAAEGTKIEFGIKRGAEAFTVAITKTKDMGQKIIRQTN